MAVYESPVLLTSKDGTGNKCLIYPITRADCVDGLDELVDEKIAEAGGGSSSSESGGTSTQVQSNYEQNDSAQADYIKNRPFYAGEMSMQEVLPITTIPFTYTTNEGVYIFTMTPTTEYLAFWGGEWNAATLTWDGVDYVCEAQYIEGIKCIGNIGVMMGTGNTGEPFIMMMADAATLGEDICIIYDVATVPSEETTDGAQVTHDIKLSLEMQEIHTLDPKFIGSVEWKKVTGAPFGDIAAGAVFVDETITMGAVSGNSINITPLTTMNTNNIVNGAAYLVTINDVQYSGIGLIEDSVYGMSITDDSGVEVAIIVDAYGGFVYEDETLFTEGEEYHIKAVLSSSAVKQIDPKYLPDDVGGIPECTTSDNGKVLTVSDGSAAWVTPASGLPTVSSSNNGKVLKVVNGVWTVADDSDTRELPSVTSNDDNKVLKVVNGAWSVADDSDTRELPDVTADDNGKFLRVVEGVAAWVTIENAEEVEF